MKTTTLSFVLILTLLVSSTAIGQRYITKTGHIRFFSTTPMEDIEANNYQVNAALDSQSGEMVFKVLMKAFEFEKALMQEHFNENYVYSDKFPNSTFQGKILNISDIDMSSPGKYEVDVEGELTIKGESNKIKEKGTLELTDKGNILANSVFMIKLKDYKIKIPSAVVDNISEEIEITVKLDMSQL
jgi:hypothetical protein